MDKELIRLFGHTESPWPDIPESALFTILERVGFEVDERGPKGELWMNLPDGARGGPFTVGPSASGWLTGPHVADLCLQLGVDPLEIYRGSDPTLAK